MFAAVGLTMPLGPSVVFTRSAMAMAPTNDACRRREGCTAYSKSIQAVPCANRSPDLRITPCQLRRMLALLQGLDAAAAHQTGSLPFLLLCSCCKYS